MSPPKLYRKLLPAVIIDAGLRSQEGTLLSFGARKIPVIALNQNRHCIAFKSRFVKEIFVSPQTKENEKFVKFLVELPQRGILIFSDDTCTELISANKELLINEGYLLNIADSEAIKTVSDKWELYQFCRKINIKTPLTSKADSPEDVFKFIDMVSRETIIKATRLGGGLYKKICCRDEAGILYGAMQDVILKEENIHRKSSLIMQEFIHSDIKDIWCTEALYTKNGIPLGFLNIQKWRTCINKDGTYGSRLYAGANTENVRLTQLSRHILGCLNWKGFAHLDWIFSREHADYMLTDFNPRLPGFSNLLYHTGFDTPYFYYADLLDLPINFSIRECLYFETFRFPGDLSGGIRSILSGQIKIKDFFGSYLKIFGRKYKKVFDVFNTQDLYFTFLQWLNSIFTCLKSLARKATFYGAN